MTFDHVGIAVERLDAAIDFYRKTIGLVVAHREDLDSQKVRVAFLRDPREGTLPIELLEPAGDEGPVARFVRSRGPGLHHVAFRADDIEASMKHLSLAGTPPLESKPRTGARGHRVCFVHPKHAGGVLVELVG